MRRSAHLPLVALLAACGVSPDAPLDAGPDAPPLPFVGTGGTPVLLAELPASELAFDATHIYAYLPNEGMIVRLPKTGGPVETLASEQPTQSGSPRPRLALAGEDLFFATAEADRAELRRVPKAGGPVVTVASVPTTSSTASIAFVLEGEEAYFAVGRRLLHVDLATGSTEVVAEEAHGAYIPALRMTPTRIYYLASIAGPSAVRSLPRGGTSPAGWDTFPLAAAHDLATDGEAVFASSNADVRSIWRVPPDPTPVLETTVNLHNLAAEGGDVFFHAESWILRQPVGGGPPVLLATVEGLLWTLAVEPDAIYFVVSDRLYRLPR